jgi:hypothetical protein
MVRLTGPYRELYDLLQAKAKASLSRVSGIELGNLGDNDTLARDIGNLPLESVTELLKRHSPAGRVW